MSIYRRFRRIHPSLEKLEDRTLLSFAPLVSYPADMNPRDVFAADFDGNGTLDLAVANNQSNSVSLYRGRNTGRFQYVGTFRTGGLEPHSIVAGDWNKDNRLDLAVANYASGDLSIFLGNGNMTFRRAGRYATGAGSTCVAVGDFDSDADLDLVTTNRYSGSGTLTVLLGNGDGSFQPAIEYQGGSKPQYATVTDLNEDGRPDLAVSEGGSNSLGVWINTGSGFTYGGNYPTGVYPHGSSAGDFNADGHADVAVVNYTSNDVTVLLGTGAGGFGSSKSYPGGTTPLGVSIGDFDLDGAQDLVVSNRDSDNVSVLLGKGNGDFEPADPYFYDAGDGASAAAVGDFNADGSPDLAVASWSANAVSILMNNGDWLLPAPAPSAPPPFDVATIDSLTSVKRAASSASPRTSLPTMPIGKSEPQPDVADMNRAIVRLRGDGEPPVRLLSAIESEPDGLADPLALPR